MHLRNDLRQKNTQKILDFNSTPTSEARAAGGKRPNRSRRGMHPKPQLARISSWRKYVRGKPEAGIAKSEGQQG